MTIVTAALLIIFSPFSQSLAEYTVELTCSGLMEIEIVNDWPIAKNYDFARIGKHTVGSDLLQYHTWAEFDITQFAGQNVQVKQIGLRIYNAWDGTMINQLQYTTQQPSTLSMHQLFGQHNRPGGKNNYHDFNMPLNPSGVWSPDSGGFFYPPGTWDAHRRVTHDNQTVLDDLQRISMTVNRGSGWNSLTAFMTDPICI